jgi:hypothetical protein
VEGMFTPLFATISNTMMNGAALYQSSDSNDGGTKWPEAVFISIAILGGCALVGVIIWQIFLTARRAIDSGAQKQHAEELQQVTQRAVASNEQSAQELAKISQNVADLNARMSAIEKLLREVE